MIDIQDLRTQPAAYKEACRKKRSSFDVDAFLALDQEYRSLKTELEQSRANQNRINKEIPTLSGEQKSAKLEEMKLLAQSVKAIEQRFEPLQIEWNKLQLFIPAIPLAEVPEGKDDSENVELRKEGKIPEFAFKAKSHIELGAELGLFDVERGVKIAGSRNYFLIGDGARLQHAVLQFTMDLLSKRGYLMMEPPHLVSYAAMMGTSYFPGGEDQAYHLDDRDDKYLIGTSEVSVTSFHKDEILPHTELPKRYAGYSPCYRREAGTYGKDAAGLYRIHQFYKVEQVILCEADPAKSLELHHEILKNAEDVLKALELPYRVVAVCTGDMGQGQVYKNDIETWMPSRNAYGETHSCSSFYDFQARRLNMRYKDVRDGKNKFCYTLNNTCIASPRVLIPLLELHQNKDGTVTIPKALRPYMGGQEVIVSRKN